MGTRGPIPTPTAIKARSWIMAGASGIKDRTDA